MGKIEIRQGLYANGTNPGSALIGRVPPGYDKIFLLPNCNQHDAVLIYTL